MLSGRFAIHSLGGISIGSTNDPGPGKISLDLPTDFSQNSEFSSSATFSGSVSFNNSVSFNDPIILPSISSNIIPTSASTYSLGSSSNPYSTIYSDNLDLNGLDVSVVANSNQPSELKFEFDGGDFELKMAPTYGNTLYFYTTADMYIFDEDIVVNNVYYTSDITLKKDVVKIKDTGSSIVKIKKLEGITYKLKEDKDNLTYAGFSAQEVQEILPDLVQETEEGHLSVSYTGIIPYLVEAIKEQQEKIQVLEQAIGLKGDYKSDNLLSADDVDNQSYNSLFQNIPNPFSERTRISYVLDNSSSSAILYVFDLEGKLRKSFNLQTPGSGEVVIDGGELEAGMYFYTMIADGIVVDSKQMVLTDK